MSNSTLSVSTYRPTLDGVRAIAILLVVLCHFHVLDFGWIGVQLFFVLSGFLISQKLIDDKDKRLGSYLRRFYTRRCLRIFPLYFGYLCLLGIAHVLTGIPKHFDQAGPFLFTYTYNVVWYELPNSRFFSHFWSLSVEEQFYIVWPYVIFFASVAKLRAIFTGIVLGWPFIRMVIGAVLFQSGLSDHWISMAMYSAMWSQVDAFSTGALLATASSWSSVRQRQLATVGLGAFLAMGIVNLAIANGGQPLTSLGYYHPRDFTIWIQYSLSYSALNAASIALIFWSLSSGRTAERILGSGLMVLTGRISYGMYVYHLPVLAILELFYPSELQPHARFFLFLIYVGLLYAISYLSYTCFEARFLRLKNKT